MCTFWDEVNHGGADILHGHWSFRSMG